MSIYGTKTLDELADQVWIDLHDKKDFISKRKGAYALNIDNEMELYIIIHAIVITRKSMQGKVKAHLDEKPKRVHEQILKDLMNIADKMGEQSLYDEQRELMAIRYKLKSTKLYTQAKMATKIADNVKRDLLENGTKPTRAKELRGFVKDALIAITQHPKRYTEQLSFFEDKFDF